MSEVPALGPYWSQNKPKVPIDFANMRQGATRQFDNAEYDIAKAWDKFRPLVLPEYERLLDDPGIGNPPLAIIDGRVCSFGSIEFAAMASIILPHMKWPGSEWMDWAPKYILEIGGGYGGLARALLMADPDIDYTIVDLPEVLECSRHYLRDFGTRAHFITPSQFSFSGMRYNMAIQTRGFMEMSLDEVVFYMSRLQDGGGMGRALYPGRLFFTINRVEKETRLRDYPFDDKWQVLIADYWQDARPMPMMLLRRTEEPMGEIGQAMRQFHE